METSMMLKKSQLEPHQPLRVLKDKNNIVYQKNGQNADNDTRDYALQNFPLPFTKERGKGEGECHERSTLQVG